MFAGFSILLLLKLKIGAYLFFWLTFQKRLDFDTLCEKLGTVLFKLFHCILIVIYTTSILGTPLNIRSPNVSLYVLVNLFCANQTEVRRIYIFLPTTTKIKI